MKTFFQATRFFFLLMLGFTWTALSVSAQSSEMLFVDLDYNASSQAVNKVEFTVALEGAVFDPAVSALVDDSNSWFLRDKVYTKEIVVLDGIGALIKITFTLSDNTVKTGSGIVASTGLGVVVVIDDLTKTGGAKAQVVSASASPASQDVTIFPNPATHTVAFEGTMTEGTVVDIVSPQGQMQTIAWEAGKTLDVSSWARGFYLLRFRNGDTALTRKLVLR